MHDIQEEKLEDMNLDATGLKTRFSKSLFFAWRPFMTSNDDVWLFYDIYIPKSIVEVIPHRGC